MDNKFFICLKVVTAYIGAVIGAGFASGQEILQFFILHGNQGLWGVLLATILFAYLGGLVMYLSIRQQTTNYQDFLSFLLAPGLVKIVDKINLIILFGGLIVMMAGSAAVFGEHFGLPPRAGVIFVFVFTSIVIIGGLDGFLTANVLLVPLKLFAVVLITCIAIIKAKGGMLLLPTLMPGGGVGGHWVWASLLYVSYNMLVPLAVLSSLGKSITLRNGVIGGIAGGLLLGVAVSLVTVAGLLYLPALITCQIPLLYLAGYLGSGFYWVLGLLIWLAILTTAIANAHGIASRLAPQGGLYYRLTGIGACLIAMPLASFDFKDLIRFLYPLFGYAGLFLLVCLLAIPIIKFYSNR
ncbi:MAG: hypothetical protein A4E53_02075 [Pelotomaculum sp. PtaB.Bin104]|nr:MAG: hypothetical protein A4E53_02075 [Pelotomaculum sp. PtaB.Bin104]